MAPGAQAWLAVARTGGGTMADDLARLGAVPWIGVIFTVLFLLGLAAGVALLIVFLVRHPRPYPLTERPWTDTETLALIAGLAVANGLMLTATSWIGTHRPEWVESGRGMAQVAVAQSLVFHWPVLIFAAVRLARKRLTAREGFGLRPEAFGRHAGLGVGLYVAIVPPVVVAAWITTLVLERMGIVPQTQDVLRLMVDAGAGPLRVYLGLLGVVIAPVAEEVLFRGLALPVLARRTGFPVAALAIAIVFAALHANAAAFLPLVVLSLGFSLAYAYTGSLLVPIVMHAMFNGVTIAAQYAAGPAP